MNAACTPPSGIAVDHRRFSGLSAPVKVAFTVAGQRRIRTGFPACVAAGTAYHRPRHPGVSLGRVSAGTSPTFEQLAAAELDALSAPLEPPPRFRSAAFGGYVPGDPSQHVALGELTAFSASLLRGEPG